jgi:hypothetical protein
MSHFVLTGVDGNLMIVASFILNRLAKRLLTAASMQQAKSKGQSVKVQPEKDHSMAWRRGGRTDALKPRNRSTLPQSKWQNVIRCFPAP